MKTRRVKAFALDMDAILDAVRLCCEGDPAIDVEIPDDARVVGLVVGQFNEVVVTIESTAYPDLRPGERVAVTDVLVCRVPRRFER